MPHAEADGLPGGSEGFKGLFASGSKHARVEVLCGVVGVALPILSKVRAFGGCPAQTWTRGLLLPRVWAKRVGRVGGLKRIRPAHPSHVKLWELPRWPFQHRSSGPGCSMSRCLTRLRRPRATRISRTTVYHQLSRVGEGTVVALARACGIAPIFRAGKFSVLPGSTERPPEPHAGRDPESGFVGGHSGRGRGQRVRRRWCGRHTTGAQGFSSRGFRLDGGRSDRSGRASETHQAC